MKKTAKIAKVIIVLFIMCMGIGVLSVNNASAGKDLNKKQILKTISKTKKEIKNLNKKIKAVKKSNSNKTKGYTYVYGKALSYDPLIVKTALGNSYYCISNSGNVSNIFGLVSGYVKKTGGYTYYYGTPCVNCSAVKLKLGNLYKLNQMLSNKKNKLKSYQNMLKDRIKMNNQTMLEGTKGSIHYRWLYSGKNNYLKFTSSDKSVATVNSWGDVKALKAGKTTITAITTISKKKSKCTLVVKPRITNMSFSQAEFSYTKDSLYNSNDELQISGICNDIEEIECTSSDTNVATVEYLKDRKAVKFKITGKGTTTITAKSAKTGVSCSCTLKYYGNTINSIEFIKTEFSIIQGYAENISSYIRINGELISNFKLSDDNLTFTSSDDSIVGIQYEKGDYSSSVESVRLVTGKPGTAVITATSSYGVTSSFTVTVQDDGIAVYEIKVEGRGKTETYSIKETSLEKAIARAKYSFIQDLLDIYDDIEDEDDLANEIVATLISSES